MLLKDVGQTSYACRKERDWPDTRQILVVVRHERVSKSEKHNEPKHRAERDNEKRGRDLDAASDISLQEVDRHAQHSSRQQPCVVQQMRR